MTNRMILTDISPLIGESAVNAIIRLHLLGIPYSFRRIDGEMIERKKKNKPENKKARLIIKDGRLIGVEIW